MNNSFRILISIAFLAVSLSGNAQLRVIPNGKAFFGEFSDSQLNTSFSWNINKYKGMQWNLLRPSDGSLLFFGIELGDNEANIYGTGNKIVFYNDDNRNMNSIVVCRMYQLLTGSPSASFSLTQSLNEALRICDEIRSYPTPSDNDTLVVDSTNMVSGGNSIADPLFFDKLSMVSMITGAAQMIQNRLIEHREKIDNIQSDYNSEEISYPVSPGEKLAVNCYCTQEDSRGFVMVSDMKGAVLKKQSFNGTGVQTLFFETDGLNPGIYRYTIYVDGKIEKTRLFIITDEF